MEAASAFSLRNAWFRWSVGALMTLTLMSLVVGFFWLPSAQADFSAQGLWASICRAAGVPAKWGLAETAKTLPQATNVVLERSMGRPGTDVAIGRGATLALNCTMCHGAQGMSSSEAPNLAGQYPEVIMKQLHDYQSGKRSNILMMAVSKGLSAEAVTDLAAYYAYLPKARTAPTTYDETLPKLVRVGDPLRNIAPCIACHGGVDQKLGAPWLEGMPKAYLIVQLNAFHSGSRHNDSEAQMRNMARNMTEKENDDVATFYAGKATPLVSR